MSLYSHILLAVDLSPECEQAMCTACKIAQANDARLSLIHVIEPIAFAYQGEVPMDLLPVQEQHYKSTTERMHDFAKKMPVACTNIFVAMGNPADEIHATARELEADLIVVGSHGRHGLALLLGSTSTSVLHGAECDVLAVRVRESTA